MLTLTSSENKVKQLQIKWTSKQTHNLVSVFFVIYVGRILRAKPWPCSDAAQRHHWKLKTSCCFPSASSCGVFAVLEFWTRKVSHNDTLKPFLSFLSWAESEMIHVVISVDFLEMNILCWMHEDTKLLLVFSQAAFQLMYLFVPRL